MTLQDPSGYPVELSRRSVITYLKATESKNLNTSTGGSAFNSSTNFNTRWQLLRILIHFSAVSSETITITFDSGDGVNFDTILAEQTLLGTEQDFVIEGDTEIDIFQRGDEINIQITASAGAPTVYVTVLAMEIP